MNDGRLVYIRWDYVDRSAANFHGLWTSNPDGTGVASLFGNYTMRINACYQPRPIPGSEKLLFLAGAHHADVGGSLVLLDPRRVGFDPQTGEDRLDCDRGADAGDLLPGIGRLAEELLSQSLAAVGGSPCWSPSASIRCPG